PARVRDSVQIPPGDRCGDGPVELPVREVAGAVDRQGGEPLEGTGGQVVPGPDADHAGVRGEPADHGVGDQHGRSPPALRLTWTRRAVTGCGSCTFRTPACPSTDACSRAQVGNSTWALLPVVSSLMGSCSSAWALSPRRQVRTYRSSLHRKP